MTAIFAPDAEDGMPVADVEDRQAVILDRALGQVSVSLQSVTFDLSIGTTDPFIVSPASGYGCVRPGRHRLLALPGA